MHILILALFLLSPISLAQAQAPDLGVGEPAAVCGFNGSNARCKGDISCDCQVTIDEYTRCVNAALYEGDFCSNLNPWCSWVGGGNAAGDIAHCDNDCNFDISVNELIIVVNNMLNGCASPCYSGFNYPVLQTQTMCTQDIFRQLFCGGALCTHASCASCP